ncbi:MAG TPA: single-stranded-DNA-specific exonuclease RecJ [Rhizomicrobium sp.]
MAPALGVEQSFAGRRWLLREIEDDEVRALSRAANISPVLARLLAARGISPSDAAAHLNPSLKDLLPEPFGFKDMERAVTRAQHAIEAGQRVAIFGDYDVDGSCSAALLCDFLTAIGRAPSVAIPDRLTEGYGPSAAALLRLKDAGAQLVITVDCGATADAALRAARNAGLDVIVLDHHALENAGENAFAQVNPNQPGDTSRHSHLCAAGVVFLFLVALNRSLREAGWYRANAVAEPDLRASLDLVGLATVCDVVPLVGVNRAFVQSALTRIGMRPRPGLKALAEIARAEAPFTPYHLGFIIGPRINAGGRVGRCSLGVELLTAMDESHAMPLALQLERHNRERQAVEAIILEEAMALAAMQDNAPFLFVAGEGWHPGVVGIIAGRLKERFGKPAFAVGVENGVGRGSARSIAGIDLGALVRAARDQGLLEAGGGHAMAAGFSLSANKMNAFQDFLGGHFAEQGMVIGTTGELELHGMFSPAGANAGLVEEIGRAGPFGAGNLEPLLVAPDLRVAFADMVGQGHIRLSLEGSDGARLQGIAFRASGSPLGDGLLKSRGKRIHAAGTLRAERWNGESRVQLHLHDAAAAGV